MNVMTLPMNHYGITARVQSSDDRVFAEGARVWVAEQPDPDSAHLFFVLGIGRRGGLVKHWIPTSSLHLFTPCTVPEPMRGYLALPRDTLVGARATASRLEAHTDALRSGWRPSPDEEVDGPEGFIHQEEDL